MPDDCLNGVKLKLTCSMKKENKTLWQKALILTLMLSIIMPAIIIAQASKANFSGSWALNEGKSSLGDGRRMGTTSSMTVTQEENKLSVAGTTSNRDGGSMTNTLTYTLDGKESVNSSQRGESKSVAVWSSDGKSLTITTNRRINMNGESRDMKSVEVWSLNDSQTLSVKSTTTMQGGDRTVTMIYDKK